MAPNFYGKPVETFRCPTQDYENIVVDKRLNGYRIISVSFEEDGLTARINAVYLGICMAD